MSEKRPIGVSILSILLALGGVAFLAVAGLMLIGPVEMDRGLAGAGASRSAILTMAIFFAVLQIAAGMGMWSGAAWGWRCGVYYCLVMVVRKVSQLLLVPGVAQQLAAAGEGVRHGPAFYYAKFAIGAAIHVLLTCYFFKANVLEYFGLTAIHRGKEIARLAGTVLVTCLAFLAMSMLG